MKTIMVYLLLVNNILLWGITYMISRQFSNDAIDMYSIAVASGAIITGISFAYYKWDTKYG